MAPPLRRARFFCGLPLFHVNGQLVTGLSPWSRGGHVVIGTPQGYRDKAVFEQFWAIVEHYRVNAFSGVPTVYAALLQTPLGSHDVSSVEFGYCGAAPMPTELFRSSEAKTGIRILEAYGLTEGGCVSSVNPPDAEPRIGSVGLRLPYQDMTVMILDEAGAFLRFADVDEPGVLAIKGPNVFSGYVNPIHNAGLWIDCGGERWLNTGDLARQDADGYFWLTGRKKELIIRGGHNIDPKLIEEPLHRHPDVALAAAIGRPDSRAGETPVLYVQLKAGATASQTELLEYASAHIPERGASEIGQDSSGHAGDRGRKDFQSGAFDDGDRRRRARRSRGECNTANVCRRRAGRQAWAGGAGGASPRRRRVSLCDRGLRLYDRDRMNGTQGEENSSQANRRGGFR